MKYDSFKVGDVWEMLVNGHPDIPRGQYFTVLGINVFGHAEHRPSTNCVSKYRIRDGEVKLISRGGKKVGEFTKADLKDGMWVTYRNGDERIVIGGNVYTKVNGLLGHVCSINGWADNLLRWNPVTLRNALDIMRVNDRDGAILFEREEKSQQQIEFEKLQQQITALQLQADKLKSTL